LVNKVLWEDFLVKQWRDKMARDKAKDDLMFNCSQDHEADQVASHYGTNKQQIINFLKKSCEIKLIDESTHKEVYELIQAKFGYAIPV
jgi:hypothetical protein